ncbi:MAG: hypothetical protein AAF611_14850 [Bacteroidota bacterium]
MKKELPYLFLCIVMALLLTRNSLDFQWFLADSTLDINMRDTYFEYDYIYKFIDAFVFTFALMYFFRIFYTKFKNRVVNYLYLSFNGLFILLLVFIIQSIYMLIKSFQELQIHSHNEFNLGFYSLIVIAVAAIVLEVYTIVRLRKRKAS